MSDVHYVVTIWGDEDWGVWAVYHDQATALAEAARVEAELDRIGSLWMKNKPDEARAAIQELERQYGRGSLEWMWRADVVVVNGL